MNSLLKVGILSIQGDIEENSNAIKESFKELEIEGTVVYMKDLKDLEEIDGLIIPGGESTVIGMLLFLKGVQPDLIRKKIQEGLPILGTCAGLIMLSNKAYDKTIGETKQALLKVLDVTIERNAFGRQHESFESELDISYLGERKFNGVFIRGPAITEIGNDVEIIAEYDKKIVAVRQNNILGTSFHPELANDNRFHTNLVKLMVDYNKSRKEK
ncbi:Glutamine amidotransferase subunit PdxT [Candidatus Nitrosocosmicus oleophilus]|uniref:Pyridoxal 5'-phosphate synthase subunit PdxT n=1 Tax=Candidatus Nitrosocosmicus oleophilus TaxID=1353260 RepID=A0A654M147_9ARCH|nr:pyridoxal 5'-phosphate synthase glutaminase subunit PdxT [Candidatus Nitrosocosmicus oleophilus]ALI37468.1 Glutamine amidotransferase subunit PdxT [Candidatus Nitrosocosmicus oleophilus]